MKSEVYSNIYTGVRQVLMEIRKDIATRLHIAGHWCCVHYRGQKRTCFECGEEGHQRDKCPRRPTPAQPVVVEASVNNGNSSNNNNLPPTEAQPMEAVQATVTTDAVASSDATRNVEEVSNDPPAREVIVPIIEDLLAVVDDVGSTDPPVDEAVVR